MMVEASQGSNPCMRQFEVLVRSATGGLNARVCTCGYIYIYIYVCMLCVCVCVSGWASDGG